ncbi:trace amine-associated receptor 13c isoform X1 [Poecilia latipinna]|uniref:trace amine-associated receptor 13c-like isoform X1 n=2 Tax=Poecilia mexicana TaxID=48701 RepID=UPI00072DC30C|nr:PREDICTED: trace amine-associated receptor 13c-like isoform X1 [Poecilia mexicana]XP_014885715.1 PREDICTED: trace amine-associated receptor 13c-like isoform X1 [Poecilia latipinna]
MHLCLHKRSTVEGSGNAGRPTTLHHGFLSRFSANTSQRLLPLWAMTELLPNTSTPVGTAALLVTSDCPFNLTAAAQTGHGSLPPLCTLCCCGMLNRTLAVAFMVSLAFAIVVGNVVTLTVFVQTRQSRTPQGYLKVSLAIADMMVGVVVVPFSVFTEISLMVTSAPPLWYQGGTSASFSDMESPWQPCMLIGPVFAGCTFVSISTIFLMTLERSVAILWPLHKDVLVTRRRTLLLILLSWAASFLLALAPLIFSSNFTLEYNDCSRMCNYAPLLFGGRLPPDANILLLFPAFDFTLLGGTLAVNIVSFTSIRRYTQKRKLLSEGSLSDGGGGGGCSHRPSFSDIKAAKTIGILTFAFTASFSPIAVFVLGNVVGYTWCNFSFLAFWILTGNSCCNVIIYSVRDHRFRKGVTLLFQREQSPPHGEKT